MNQAQFSASKPGKSTPLTVSVREFFNDKNVLMTGVTGFVGKVLLEKYLSCIPRVGKIYLLIRDKPKFTLEERLNKEIFGSKIFEPLF